MEGFAPNKALGQNFLVDKTAVARIIELADVRGRRVLEIGPGTGAITGGLCDAAAAVLAVELDARLAAALPPRDNLTVLCRDILDTDLGEAAEILGGAFRVAANLPYHITTPVAVKLALCPAVERVTLMVQREAAGRFFAGPGDRQYGPMAALYGRYFSGNIAFTLTPAAFSPRPDVDSAVVCLERTSVGGEAAFYALCRAAFAQRRKTLYNNLAARFGGDAARAAIERCGLAPAVRAEKLSPDALAGLAKILC